jgi:hypothetical protein
VFIAATGFVARCIDNPNPQLTQVISKCPRDACGAKRLLCQLQIYFFYRIASLNATSLLHTANSHFPAQLSLGLLLPLLGLTLHALVEAPRIFRTPSHFGP